MFYRYTISLPQLKKKKVPSKQFNHFNHLSLLISCHLSHTVSPLSLQRLGLFIRSDFHSQVIAGLSREPATFALVLCMYIFLFLTGCLSNSWTCLFSVPVIRAHPHPVMTGDQRPHNQENYTLIIWQEICTQHSNARKTT